MANAITIAMMLNLIFPFIKSDKIEINTILIQILEDIHPLSKLRYLNAKVKIKRIANPPEPYSGISRIAVVKFFPWIVKHYFGLIVC
jgi:hypothetical protein